MDDFAEIAFRGVGHGLFSSVDSYLQPEDATDCQEVIRATVWEKHYERLEVRVIRATVLLSRAWQGEMLANRFTRHFRTSHGGQPVRGPEADGILEESYVGTEFYSPRLMMHVWSYVMHES